LREMFLIDTHKYSYIIIKNNERYQDAMNSTFFFLILLWYSAGNGQGSASQESSEIALRMDSLFQVLSAREGFNGNVLIAKAGKVIYKKTFGYADLKLKTPLNIKSVFQIGSITKQFTAMAIMMLHDEGKLNFTDPVQLFFPKFPYNNITIHQLLSHRSGLPEYMRFAKRYWKNNKKPMRNTDLMNIMIEYRPTLVFAPDEEYYYSNTGYVVLACIIEHVSGISYSAFLEKHIFKPLGMKMSFVSNKKKIEDVKYPTVGYKQNKRRATEDYLSGTVGDKGIYSTVEDMLKWDQCLYTEKLVRQSTLQEAFTPFSYDKQNEKNYGYGWRIETSNNGDKIVYHAGWWRGYSSLFVRRLADKSVVIILCNKVNTSYEDVDLLMSIIDSSKQDSAISDSD
jgi:CubicO group peptidase (beta-lactamase class C family)